MAALAGIVGRARVAGDTAAEMRSLYLLGGMHHEAARLEEARRAYRAASEVAERAGRPWAPYGFDARLLEAVTAYQAGDWDGALAVVTRVPPPAPPVADALLTGVRMAVLAGRGDPTVPALLAQVRPLWERDGMLVITSGSAALAALGDAGDLAAALRWPAPPAGALARCYGRFAWRRRRVERP